jgi:hypothetical protein
MTIDRSPTSMRIARSSRVTILSALLLCAGLGACSHLPDAALVDPAKYDLYSCKQLDHAMKEAADRNRELKRLEARAMRDPSGELVSDLTYVPEFKSWRGNMALMEEVSQRKDCDPPVVVPPEFRTK